MDIGAKDWLYELLEMQRPTAVVDIGANPIDGVPPYKVLLDAGLCTVVGFEPQPAALASLNKSKGPLETYLPYVVGDGSEKLLYIAQPEHSGMTSLLEPDPDRLALFNDFSHWGRIVATEPVPTVRLDDISEIETLDFLKIDIQGAEYDVFCSGGNKLSRAVAIQTEVSFMALYKDQPSQGMLDIELRRQGFVPHGIASLKRWPIAPAMPYGQIYHPLHQILEADFVYVRDFTRPDNMDAEQWKHLALIAHHCYLSYDLTLRAIDALVHHAAIRNDAHQIYLEHIKASGMKSTVFPGG